MSNFPSRGVAILERAPTGAIAAIALNTYAEILSGLAIILLNVSCLVKSDENFRFYFAKKIVRR